MYELEYKYKIRKIGHSTSSGDIFGITIPRCIAHDPNFSGAKLALSRSGNNVLILEKVEL